MSGKDNHKTRREGEKRHDPFCLRASLHVDYSKRRRGACDQTEPFMCEHACARAYTHGEMKTTEGAHGEQRIRYRLFMVAAMFAIRAKKSKAKQIKAYKNNRSADQAEAP